MSPRSKPRSPRSKARPALLKVQAADHKASDVARARTSSKHAKVGRAKVERAKRLPPAARPARPLHADLRLGAAAARLLSPAVTAVESSWQRLLDVDTPEGAHKLRVALRRLRVVLHIFRHHDDAGQIRHLRKTLGGIAREVGRLRDLDVLIADIVAPFVETVPGTVELSVRLATARIGVRVEVCVALRAASADAVRTDLAALPATLRARLDDGGYRGRIVKLARRDLRTRWRHVSASAGDLDHLDAEHLHDVRKRLKSLRYALACFASLYAPHEVARFRTHLERLQSTFGYLNDVASAEQLRSWLSAEPAHMAQNCAIGFVLGAQTERAAQARIALPQQFKVLAATRLARRLAH